MQRYFVEPHQILDKTVLLEGDDAHHIAHVTRRRPGDRVVVCDGTGNCFLAELRNITSKEVAADIVEVVPEQRELPVRVTIAQGLPKGDKLEWIIQKGTELGASAFLPFSSERTVVKLDEKKEGRKRERWAKIAKEAAEQSHRSIVPAIHPPLMFADLLIRFGEFDAVLMAYEQEHARHMRDVCQSLKPGATLLVLIGPEGGFSEEEVRKAEEAGAVSVSLGPRILRTETASQYVLAGLSVLLEKTT